MQKEVNNKIMYHLHDNNFYKNNWDVGDDFTVDENHKSFAYYFFLDKQFDKIKRLDLFYKIDDLIDGNINNKELDIIGSELKFYIWNQPIALCEYVLENIRKQEFPNLISRAHCLYLTDKKSLKFWMKRLNNVDRTLYEFEVSGKYFIGHNRLLPDRNTNIFNQENQARCYWSGDVKAYPYEYSNNDREYLFQGHVKVLKKTNIKNM